MPDLIAIAYAEQTLAAQAAEELERCASELLIDPDAFGVIVCERDGTHQLISSHHDGANAGWSMFWGVLLGSLMGELERTGVDPGFRDEVRRLLTPGSSALFMAVEAAQPASAALSHYGGTVLRTSLPEDGMVALEREPDGEHAGI